jgi:hypothetical protein
MTTTLQTRIGPVPVRVVGNGHLAPAHPARRAALVAVDRDRSI